MHPSHNNRRLPCFTPPHELELVQLRSALAHLQGEQMLERTAVTRAGQIDEIVYKMKVASQRYNGWSLVIIVLTLGNA